MSIAQKIRRDRYNLTVVPQVIRGHRLLFFRFKFLGKGIVLAHNTKVVASSPVLKKVCGDDIENVLPFTLDDVKVELSSLDTDMEKRVFVL